ncbi:MAG TPA: glycosyltransferase family 39 protein [Kofleriaceae bacterium]
MGSVRQRLESIAIATVLVGLCAWSFAERWDVLASSPFPVGVDGYFYPIQLRSLLETGSLQYAASPLAFWVMAPLAAATDPIVGAKLGAALFGALIAFPAYGVGVRLGRARGAGLVAAILATRSAGSMYLSIEFVKNGLGLTLAMTALWLLLRALELPTRGRIGGFVVALVLAMLAHKMAAAIVLGIAIPATLVEVTARGELRGRRLLYTIGMLGAGGVAAIIAGVVAPQRFVSPGDLALLGELFTSDAQWTLPALARDLRELPLGHEALIGLVLAALAAIALMGSPVLLQPGARVLGWCGIGLAAVIGIPWLDVSDPQGLAFRLRLAAFVPLALCAAIVTGALLALGRRELGAALVRRGGLDDAALARHTKRAESAVVAIVLGILALRTPGARTDGRVLAHPAMIAAAQAMTDRIPAGDTAIIPERHIAFMVAWYTRTRVAIRPDGVPVANRWRVLPRHFIGIDSELDRALLAIRSRTDIPRPLGVHPLHPNGLVIVSEPTWQALLASLPENVRSRWARWPTI